MEKYLIIDERFERFGHWTDSTMDIDIWYAYEGYPGKIGNVINRDEMDKPTAINWPKPSRMLKTAIVFQMDLRGEPGALLMGHPFSDKSTKGNCLGCGHKLTGEAKRLNDKGCLLPCVDCISTRVPTVTREQYAGPRLTYGTAFHYLHSANTTSDDNCKKISKDMGHLVVNIPEAIDIPSGSVTAAFYDLLMFFDLNPFSQYLDHLSGCSLTDDQWAVVDRSIRAVNQFTARRMRA